MEKLTTEENDEMEIDLRELLFEFKKKLWLIVLSVLIGAVSVGLWSQFLITPQYKSEAKLYVLSKETTLTSLADLQIGSQLTQDYKILVSSRPVMEGVISDLNLDMTYKELAKKLEVENPPNTRILSLIVTDSDPYMAKAIADSIAETSSNYIGEIMEMIPPKLIEDGVVATVQSSPNAKKNAIIGGLLALLIICGIITLQVVTNDTVKTEEDVEKYLGLPVLAVIPKKNDERKKESGYKKNAKGKTAPVQERSSRRKQATQVRTLERKQDIEPEEIKADSEGGEGTSDEK